MLTLAARSALPTHPHPPAHPLVCKQLPELPAFFFFGRILAALGMHTLLLGACATLGLRIAAYAVRGREGCSGGGGGAGGCGAAASSRQRASACTRWALEKHEGTHATLRSLPPCAQLLPRAGVGWVLPIEALHALTYACGWSGARGGRAWGSWGSPERGAVHPNTFTPRSPTHRFPSQRLPSTAPRSHPLAWRAPHRCAFVLVTEGLAGNKPAYTCVPPRRASSKASGRAWGAGWGGCWAARSTAARAPPFCSCCQVGAGVTREGWCTRLADSCRTALVRPRPPPLPTCCLPSHALSGGLILGATALAAALTLARRAARKRRDAEAREAGYDKLLPDGSAPDDAHAALH